MAVRCALINRVYSLILLNHLRLNCRPNDVFAEYIIRWFAASQRSACLRTAQRFFPVHVFSQLHHHPTPYTYIYTLPSPFGNRVYCKWCDDFNAHTVHLAHPVNLIMCIWIADACNLVSWSETTMTATPQLSLDCFRRGAVNNTNMVRCTH